MAEKQTIETDDARARNAALLILSLEKDQASVLLRGMSDTATARLCKAMKEIDESGATDAITREALRGFFRSARDGVFTLGNTGMRFRDMLSTARGEDMANRMFTADPSAQKKRKKPVDETADLSKLTPLEALQAVPEEMVALIAERESPRVAALMLSQMGGRASGRIVSLIEDAEKRESVVQRLITGEVPPAEVVDCVMSMLHQQLMELGPESEGASDADRAADLAELVNSLDKESQDRVLNQLSETDPEMSVLVEQEMFSFKDLVGVGQRSMQELLRNVEIPLIAMALKGAQPDVASHFEDNLSARARERVHEEREMAGRVAMSEVDQAREEIMKVARRMYREGDIVLETGDEEYVE